jgi:hypothetical protein
MTDSIDIDSVWAIGHEEVQVLESGIAGVNAVSEKYKDGVGFVRYRIVGTTDSRTHAIGEKDEMMKSAFVQAYDRVDEPEPELDRRSL